jgi:hypothetical protein
MQFIQQQLYNPQRPLFPLTTSRLPARELFAYWVNERGEIITPDKGAYGNWTYYAKKLDGSRNRLSRGRRIKTRPASWFPTRQQALEALNDYGRQRGWIPAANVSMAICIVRIEI